MPGLLGPRATMKKTPPLTVGRGPVPRHASCWQCSEQFISDFGFKACPSPGMRLAGRPHSPCSQDRLILIRSGAGAPELQRLARCLPVGEAHHLSLRAPNVWQHRDQEVSPTKKKSRPEGLSYRLHRDMKSPHVIQTRLSRKCLQQCFCF